VVQVKLKIGKKAIALGDIATIAIVFVVAGIALGVGAEVLNDIFVSVNSTTGTYTTPGLAVANASEGIAELAKWMPTIGLVIAAALIIGIVFQSFVKGRY